MVVVGVIAAVIGIASIAYLLFALIWPERL